MPGVEITPQILTEEFLALSKEKPVILICWSPRSAESEEVVAILGKLASDDQGAWIFGRVDVDAQPTICDVVVLPGPDALRAPEWIPYRDRILPGDVGVGDIVPSALDDTRLVPGQQALPQDEDLDTAMAIELGLGRARVLSIEGRDQAAKRWYDGERGPNAPVAQSAPKPCHSCGFFIPIAGSLRATFGVCANAISPDDARVVSVDHGCGAHSEATFTEPVLN